MNDSTIQERDAMLEGILAVARREILVLAAARQSSNEEASVVAAGRLRWQLACAQLHAMSSPAGYARVHARLMDVIQTAHRWLPTYPLTAPSPERCQRLLLGLVEPISLLSRIDASGATLAELDLDGLPLARLGLAGATVIGVTAHGARLDEMEAAEATMLRSRFDAASLRRANFEHAAVEDCSFSSTNLELSHWGHATMLRCVATRAVLLDARLDGATLIDCDFRQADFQAIEPTGVSARFVRCDLRETNWRGRTLRGATFTDCKLWGAVDAGDVSEAVIERPDLSSAGDGSRVRDKHDAVNHWSCSADLAIHLWS